MGCGVGLGDWQGWVAGWVWVAGGGFGVGCGVGFRLISVGGLARGGLRGGFRGGFWWLAMVVSIFGGFRWFWLWVFSVDLFYVAPNTQCKIFSRAFS